MGQLPAGFEVRAHTAQLWISITWPDNSMPPSLLPTVNENWLLVTIRVATFHLHKLSLPSNVNCRIHPPEHNGKVISLCREKCSLHYQHLHVDVEVPEDRTLQGRLRAPRCGAGDEWVLNFSLFTITLPNLLFTLTHHKFIWYFVRKVSCIFSRKCRGFQWSAVAWRDFEPSYACVNFLLQLMATSIPWTFIRMREFFTAYQ